MSIIEPGLTGEKTLTVLESDTARASADESLPAVLSTPRIVSLLENTAHNVVLPHLKEGQTTVGILVNIHHMAATPVGMQVKTRAELLEVDRRRLRFKVEAWDEVEKIAEGEHERFIIDKDRFEERLVEKRKVMGKSGNLANNHPGK